MQALMFPLSDEELKAKGKEMAALELKFEELASEKDTKSREYNEALKKIRGQIARLAKEIDEEQEFREPTAEEAPWQGLVDQAQDRAGEIRRGRAKRDHGSSQRLDRGEFPDGEGE